MASPESDLAGAIARYQQAIATDPADISNYWSLGLAWLIAGDEAEAQSVWSMTLAEATLDQIESWVTDLLQVLQQAATQQLQDGKFWVAEPICRQILELDADRADIYDLLGRSLAQQGQFDQAIACWQQATDLDPLLIEADQQQGEVCQKLEEFDQAIACYTRVIKLQPDRSDTYYRLGLCLLQQGQTDQAIAHFMIATQLNPGFSQAYGEWGFALLQSNFKVGQSNSLEAIDCLKQMSQLQSGFVQSYLGWQLSLTKQGRSNPVIDANAELLRTFSFLSETAEVDLQKLYRQSKPSQLDPSQLEPADTDQGFYESTWDWAKSNGLAATNYIELDHKNPIALIPPQTIDPTIHFSFRFGQAIELPETFVATIPNGRFWLNPDQTSSALFTSDHKFLADLSPEFPILSPGHPDKHPAYHSIRNFVNAEKLPPANYIDGTVAVLSGLMNHLYFHWMLDVLPRIELLRRSQIDWAEIDYFYIDDRLPFQQETLQILGIPTAKILRSDRSPHIQARKLIAPSYPGSVSWMSKWTCEFLRNHFLGQTTTVTKGNRLYISRRSAANRRIINEDAVIERLTQVGFQVVTFEQCSVIDQATLMSTAQVVIAPHGGGLTNLVFCPPGTKVIELFSPNYVYPCYWFVSNLADLKYYYLLGELPFGFHIHQQLYPDPRLEDVYIDLDKLAAVMKLADVIN
jgi:capsular polysaccharide biosynthesis protein/tetratricopeptide (TPR) repeat protein